MYRKMDRFSLISTKLPFEIQNEIISLAEKLWYNNSVNKIINNWYRFIARKIVTFNLLLTLKKNKFNLKKRWSRIITTIDPLDEVNSKKIKYIEKYYTGNTEDQEFWYRLIVKILNGLQIAINPSIINREWYNPIHWPGTMYYKFKKQEIGSYSNRAGLGFPEQKLSINEQQAYNRTLNSISNIIKKIICSRRNSVEVINNTFSVSISGKTEVLIYNNLYITIHN